MWQHLALAMVARPEHCHMRGGHMLLYPEQPGALCALCHWHTQRQKQRGSTIKVVGGYIYISRIGWRFQNDTVILSWMSRVTMSLNSEMNPPIPPLKKELKPKPCFTHRSLPLCDPCWSHFWECNPVVPPFRGCHYATGPCWWNCPTHRAATWPHEEEHSYSVVQKINNLGNGEPHEQGLREGFGASGEEVSLVACSVNPTPNHITGLSFIKHNSIHI